MRKEAVTSTIEMAKNFLLCYIEEHGIWEDFYIEEPGISDEWVTSYVGNCLLELPYENDQRLIQVLQKAAQFLITNMREDGGWGYNHNCRSDCDSTTHTIFFLGKMGYPIERKSIELLCHYWKHDGGFTTYLNDSSGSWNHSHIDVTLVTASLLRDVFLKNEQALERLQRYVKSWFDQYELPPAFWWTSKYYTALAGIEYCKSYKLKYPRERVLAACIGNKLENNVFDLALHLNLLIELDSGESVVEEYVNKLASLQEKNGSFNGAKILRVTPKDCNKPWDIEEGDSRLAEDIHSLYTTATVLRSLCRVREHIT